MNARIQVAENQSEPDIYETGQIVVHSSEDGAGPDIGWSLGLGNGQALWFGEISDAAHQEAGSAAADLGPTGGTWIALYDASRIPEKQITILGRASDPHAGEELLLVLAAGLRKWEPEENCRR